MSSTVDGVSWARTSEEVVDGGGVYFSRIVTAGPMAFLGGVATDGVTSVAKDAQVAPPYSISPAAHVVAQTRYIMQRYDAHLRALGSDLNELLQVEQWIPHKNVADGYLDTSRGIGFMERRRPASALIVPGDLMPRGSVISPMGIGLVPGFGFAKEIPAATPGFQESITLDQFGENQREEGPFNEVVTAGPYVYVVGDQVTDWAAGMIEESVRLPEWTWWGSAIRNECQFLLNRLDSYMQRANSDLSQVIHSTVYLLDGADLFELDRVWRRRFPVDPPARSVVPVRALGIPRREVPGLKHFDGAIQMEHLSLGMRPGHDTRREVVSTGRKSLTHESEAIRAGHFLWISGQVDMNERGVARSTNIDSQVEEILIHMGAICEAGGTSLANLVRLRGFVVDASDAYAVYAGLRRFVPSDPPTVGVTGIEPLPYPGCKVMLDGIAFVP